MHRYEEICVELQRELRIQAVGSRLPSFRELMARFGSSQATVDRALQKLESDGFIHRRQGSGIFVGEAARLLNAARMGTVEFLVHDVSNRATALLVGGGEEVSRERGFRTQVRSYRDRLSTLDGSPAPDVRGLVFQSSSVEVDRGGIVRFLDRLPPELPHVLLEIDVPGRRCPFVGFDDFGAGMQAAKIFKKRGIRRLACLGSSVSHVNQTRLSGLAAGLGAMPELLVDFPSPDRFDRDVLRRLPGSGVEGLFIARPDMTLQTLCFLESLGIRVPKQLFVVTIAEEEDEQYYPFPVVRVIKPTTEVGREAVRALASSEPTTVRLPYRVSERS
jgi:DNA-binding LacI/PurR family transcriptional regulator